MTTIFAIPIIQISFTKNQSRKHPKNFTSPVRGFFDFMQLLLCPISNRNVQVCDARKAETGYIVWLKKVFFFFYFNTAFIFGDNSAAHTAYSFAEGCNPSVAISEGSLNASLVDGVMLV